MTSTNEFTITWNSLSFKAQTDIKETLADYILADLRDEAIEKKVSFKELMTDKNYYGLEDDEFFKLHIADLVEELTMTRIEVAFNNVKISI